MVKSRVLELNASDERGIGVTAILCDIRQPSLLKGISTAKAARKVAQFYWVIAVWPLALELPLINFLFHACILV